VAALFSGNVAIPTAMPGVLPDLGPVQLEDQVGEAVDGIGGLRVAGLRVDHPVDHQPGHDSVEVAEFPIEAGEH
jgi:hypothetical protein